MFIIIHLQDQDSIFYSLDDYYTISRDDELELLMFNRLSIGDFDLEGYPDIILNLRASNKQY